MRLSTQRLVLAVDLASVAVFALQGAAMGIRADLDLFGVLVLSFVAALGGGVARDLLIGATPPQALRTWWYPALPVAVGAATFLFNPWVRQIPFDVLLVLDAVGLGMAAMAGTEKTLSFGLNPFVAILIGGLNAVGGGVGRDILLNTTPRVLRTADIYCTAAMTGALVLILAQKAGVPPRWAAVLGFVACVALRLVAVWQNWRLPHGAAA